MKDGFGIRYGPHLVAFSVGYVIFSYAAVPEIVMQEFDVGFTAVGLLMSAALISFVGVQSIGGRLVDDRPTLPVLFTIAVLNALLAVVLDLVSSFVVLLGIRAVWGLIGGLAVTVCATHISRVYEGPAATWHQSLNGGLFAFGGAVSYVVTPQIVVLTGWFGLHAVGALIAIPAIATLWADRDQASSTEHEVHSHRGETAVSANRSVTARNPIVLLASICNAATLGAYITLSTFVTAYFDDLGIVGPVNAIALLLASFGRFSGGIAIVRPNIQDGHLIAAASGIGSIGLLAITVGDGLVLVVLLFISLAAVSLPFGAILKIAATTATRDATAVAIVVAAGNAAGLVLPVVTGWVRDVTGGYDVAFALLALLNFTAAIAGLTIARKV